MSRFGNKSSIPTVASPDGEKLAGIINMEIISILLATARADLQSVCIACADL